MFRRSEDNMRTYQDYVQAVKKGRLISFLRDAIYDHRNSEQYELATHNATRR